MLRPAAQPCKTIGGPPHRARTIRGGGVVCRACYLDRMKMYLLLAVCLASAACASAATTPGQPDALDLPDSIVVLDAGDGSPLDAAELLRRLTTADVVLLGEVHDNAVHHEVRGQLIAASAVRPAIVFEQFDESHGPISSPGEGESMEAWLDRNGFDRESWSWPLHRSVVDAAIAHGSSLWGSGVPREALRSVVREGESAAPSHLRPLLNAAPLDDAARAILDHELDVGHCGQLPANMLAGMRAAQTVRDAAMTRALLDAREHGGGPVWLIAGNGHVRRDIAVPRLLRAAAPELDVLTVGFLERPAAGGEPDMAERAPYDIVVVTPRTERPDPCAAFRAR